MSSQAEVKEKLYNLFSPLYITFLVILMYISVFFSWASEAAIGKSGTLVGWFIPYIYFFLLLEFLGRISPRFRLNPAQIIALLIPLTYASGKSYLSYGAVGETWFDAALQSGFMAFTVGAQVVSDAYKVAVRTLPSFFIPHSDLAVQIVWNGLSAGQTIPWDVWVGPVITWALVYITMNVLNIGLGFLLLGPQWTEVEHLVFPLSVPSIYAIEQFTSRDEQGRSKLFSISQNKVFWVSFVIGFILSSLPFLAEVFPPLAIWGAFYWGEFPLAPLRDYLNPLLPGADLGATFILMQAVLMVLLPYEIMITSLVTFVLIQIIYGPIAVRLGWMTYSPGATYWDYGNRLPFPYQNFAISGLSIGFALYLLWSMRSRFKTIWESLTKKDTTIGDLSVRQATLVTIASIVLMLVIWVAVGIPIIIALVLLALYVLYQVAAARYMNEIWWHQPIIMHWQWQLYYPIGASLGYWSWNAPQNNQALMATNTMMTALGGWGGPRQTIYATSSTTWVYWMAKRLKASIKQTFIWYVLVAILSWPIVEIFHVFMLSHLGASHLDWAGGYQWWPSNAMTMGITELTNGIYSGFSWSLNYFFTIAGIVLIWILIYLKSYPWFGWFNPSAFILTMWLPEYMWLASLVALIIKYASYKALGARKTEQYLVPAAAGVAIGFGAPYLFAGLYLFLTVAWPTIITFWR
ncbi:MAG: DUF6785 family protein [Thermoproteota archaeon]|jgi:hypothetical protein